jgi:hypothetical protein
MTRIGTIFMADELDGRGVSCLAGMVNASQLRKIDEIAVGFPFPCNFLARAASVRQSAPCWLLRVGKVAHFLQHVATFCGRLAAIQPPSANMA